ncbi:MAG: hypothetical protein LBF78_01130, partial [Treponema sp.]|nr:hypothetical protein [Treponema sp.]
MAACDNPTGGKKDTYGIALSANGGALSGTYTFTAQEEDYPAVTPLTVTVTNTGNKPTGTLAVSLSGTGADSFALTPGNGAVASIDAGKTGPFTVDPKTGLA